MPSNKLTMPSISFFILGLVVATVKANETTLWNTTDPDLHNSTTTTTTTTSVITSIITSITNANTPSIYMNKNDIKSTPVPATTAHPGFSDSGKETSSSHPDAKTEKATSTPSGSSASTKSNSKTTPKSSSKTAGTDKTGIIILIVLIIVIAGFLTACYLVHKRRRRYSADISSRQDEVNIPLSTVEPVGTAPHNGLTTFESTETAAKEPEEAKPEAEAEAQEEQKAQTGSAGDPSAEGCNSSSSSRQH
ncbi:probable serine/threonine-protein kinase DDB_G0277071 isoform X1 [Archocentrus centrarchus]|uniref:probable serine/threonine-protein kinase DDB_G0277071 isoform X1 n=1 Tax=Archocentrus centrarchus TaxID=63155 RepID=UPI0011EA2593|nr:probable serine/threonine-protein kinase DDB_G0277071 isoform X1 [Archocentrus centrarchus]